MSVRTRFAPSPTGFLHIGGARTALYSWLYARKNNGVFILRIEDTDLERSTQEAVDAIIEGMNWLGLDYDEGPYFQMQRMGRYREVLQKMLAEGTAYRCYCSKERLEKLREEQTARKEKPRYDGHCRNLTEILDQPYVIRFKNPQEGEVSFNDKVRGTVTFKNKELDDLIIARTDGTPTYNFTVVIDDWDMRITHVIRGDDHVNNTPRQINILKALDAELPVYAHVPMILGSDGKRLSKRHGAVSVTQYREEGFLPEALLNYLVRLGWSAGDQEIFSREEMIRLFDLDNLNKSPAAFNFEKLVWLNQHYFKTSDIDYLVKNFQPHLERLNVNTSCGPTLYEVVMAQRERCKTFIEMAEKSRFFYEDTVVYVAEDIDKHFTADLMPVFQELLAQLQNVPDWQRAHLNQIVHDVAEKFSIKLGKIAQPLRIAVTGGTISPSIDVTLELLGKAKVLTRLQQAIKLMEKK